MIPRAIWTSLKKDDGGKDGEEAPRKHLPLPRERRTAKEEKRSSAKPSKESISREEAKTDLVRLSRMEDREEASKVGMSVDDWLAEKKEKSKKEKQGTVSGRDLFLKDPTMLARHVEEDDGEDFDLTREQEDDDGTKVMNNCHVKRYNYNGFK